MKYRAISFDLLIVLTTLAISSSALASCAFSTNSSLVSYNQTLPMTELSIPRNATVGPYGTVVSFQSGPGTGITCTGSVTSMMKFSTEQTPETGVANVFKTGVPGLGFRVWDDYSIAMFVGNTLTPWWSLPGWGYGAYITNVKMQFYITGPVSPGVFQFSGPFVETWANTNETSSGALRYAIMNLNSSVTVKVKTCETPNISVDLEKHNSAEFSGIHSKSTAKSFNFEIKNCSSGMNSVNYTFTTAADVTLQLAGDVNNQYITLDGSSTASGVGIQVLYDNGSIVPFNSKIKYNGYSTSTGGSYTIPMKARYIQTASTIRGGTANSAVEFTMSYE